MGLNICTGILVAFCAFFLPHSTSGTIMSINEYFPEIHRDLTKVTWAHAVNSHEKLKSALADTSIMMLEADIVMGMHDSFQDTQPIMGHPPDKSSDLSFVQFLDAVFRATKSEGKRKGIKLDFKELEGVEPCLKILKGRLEESDATSIPVFINADILVGPVNSTKKPIDPEVFLSLVKEYAPSSTLSVGWTTRFGTDDPSDVIREGAYTKDQMTDMYKTLRRLVGDSPVFPHITFPVRAGLAAHSADAIVRLLGKIRTQSSITLWSSKTDPVDRERLQRLMVEVNARNCFVDLPFSLHEIDQEDETDAEVIDNPHQKDHGLSAVQQLEGRNSEESTGDAASSSTMLSSRILLPVITLALLTTAYYAFRRH